MRRLVVLAAMLGACAAPAERSREGGDVPGAAAGGDAGLASEAPDASGAYGAPDPDPGEDRVSARFTTTYRGRFGASDHDHDLTQTLDLDVGDPAEDPVTFRALLHGAADLDGDADAGGDFAFYSLADTYDHRLTGRVHHLYADLHGIDGLARARIGRQLLFDTPEVVHVDGLLLETAPRGARAARFGAWGGVPALPYESSRDGDLALGLYAAADAGAGLGLRADWMHLEDGELAQDDDLLALSGRWRPRPELAVEASHSRLDLDPRDLEVAARAFLPEDDLALEARYYELFRAQKALATPLDPFFTPLLELAPFREVGVSASKGIGERWWLAAGLDGRRVADQDDVGPSNRDFTRWYATASADELLFGAVSCALTAEVWDGEGDRYETWGLDLSRELEGGWRIDAGSFYSLYKYVLYLDEEREDVRTWYAGVRRRASATLSWRARYELEENDLDDFHTLRVGITWQL